jgi:uncharacterized membrane protein
MMSLVEAVWLIGPVTFIAVTIYVVDICNVRLIPASDVEGTILCVDRFDRFDRRDRNS